MFKRVPGLVLWVLLACVVAFAPMSCKKSGGGGGNPDSSTRDGATEAGPIGMTSS
jgi:hypothetical protein